MDGAALFLAGKVPGYKQIGAADISAHAQNDPLRPVANRTGEEIAGVIRAAAERSRASTR